MRIFLQPTAGIFIPKHRISPFRIFALTCQVKFQESILIYFLLRDLPESPSLDLHLPKSDPTICLKLLLLKVTKVFRLGKTQSLLSGLIIFNLQVVFDTADYPQLLDCLISYGPHILGLSYFYFYCFNNSSNTLLCYLLIHLKI